MGVRGVGPGAAVAGGGARSECVCGGEREEKEGVPRLGWLRGGQGALVSVRMRVGVCGCGRRARRGACLGNKNEKREKGFFFEVREGHSFFWPAWLRALSPPLLRPRAPAVALPLYYHRVPHAHARTQMPPLRRALAVLVVALVRAGSGGRRGGAGGSGMRRAERGFSLSLFLLDRARPPTLLHTHSAPPSPPPAPRTHPPT